MTLRTLLLIQAVFAIGLGIVVTKSALMFFSLVLFIGLLGVRVVFSTRWHRVPWSCRTFSYPCSCGVVAQVTAGQAGADRVCCGCGKSLRVPALSLLASEAVVTNTLLRRSAGSRFCLGALLFWVTVASLAMGFALVQRDQMRRHRDSDANYRTERDGVQSWLAGFRSRERR